MFTVSTVPADNDRTQRFVGRAGAILSIHHGRYSFLRTPSTLRSPYLPYPLSLLADVWRQSYPHSSVRPSVRRRHRRRRLYNDNIVPVSLPFLRTLFDGSTGQVNHSTGRRCAPALSHRCTARRARQYSSCCCPLLNGPPTTTLAQPSFSFICSAESKPTAAPRNALKCCCRVS